MAGRPSGYSQELSEKIMERIAEGESLRTICLDDDMPCLRTVMDWLEKHLEFRSRCARAREMQGDLMDDLILTTANNCTPETAHADKVKISAYQWRAMKLAPKKYGDRQEIEHSGALTVTSIGFKGARGPNAP
jgi:hypothetical protein